jgi:hypothetical protein
MPILAKFVHGSKQEVPSNLSEALRNAVYCYRTSQWSSTGTRGPTEATLDAIGSTGIVVKASTDNRLERIVLDFRASIAAYPTASFEPYFDLLRSQTHYFLKGKNRHEIVSSHQLAISCHALVRHFLESPIFKMKLPHWRERFTQTTSVDMVIQPQATIPASRANPPRTGTRAHRLGPSGSSVFEDVRDTGSKKRTKAERRQQQQFVGLELKTEMAGKDEDYSAGLESIHSLAQLPQPQPFLLQVRNKDGSLWSNDTGVKPAKGSRVLATSEPLHEHFVRRVAQNGQYLFQDPPASNLRPPPHIVNYNGVSFWISFRTAPKEMAITKLYPFDDNIRFLEAMLALAWATLTRHELVYREDK